MYIDRDLSYVGVCSTYVTNRLKAYSDSDLVVLILKFTRTKVRYTLTPTTNNSNDYYRLIVIGQPRLIP